MATSVLIHQFTSGLCNRLRALSGLVPVAELLGLPWKHSWKTCRDCPDRYDALFEPCGELINEQQAQQMARDRNCLVFKGNNGAQGATRPPSLYRDFVPEDARFLYDMRVKLWRDHLRPLPHLRHIIDELTQGFQEHNIVGVHVRRTDIVPKLKGLNSDAVLLARLSDLVKEDPAVRFFVAADNLQSREMLQRAFPNRVICYTTAFGNGFRKTNLQDAVVELYALSRTKRIIGTAHSSFSCYAADLGEIPTERL